jgi:SCF-associated factor 1
MSITDLPLDILVLVFPYLPADSFLALCSTCKAFQQSSIRLDPAYWSFATRSTFRIPNQPVVQYDGVRWQSMFRRLLTQSRVFTWVCRAQLRGGIIAKNS